MARDDDSKSPDGSLRRPSLGSRDERPSSEFLGAERSRISIIAEDSDERTDRTSGSSPELDDVDEKPSRSSSYSDHEDDGDDEDDDEILPESLTEDWEEKMSRFSQANTLQDRRRRESETVVVLPDDKADRRKSTGSATSIASRCSHCGHHRRASSVTLANAPVVPMRKSSLPQRHGSLRITPRVQPMSPKAAAASEAAATAGCSEQRAFPLNVKRVPSHAMSDVQVARHVQSDGNNFSEPRSETASIISSIFAPSLRHLASHPSLNGSLGSPVRRGSIVTPVAEQRHPGKAGARISRFTRPFEPDIDEDDGEDYLRQVRRLEALRAQQRISQVLAADIFCEKEEWVEGWPLVFLIIGICLVVFIISVHRTIITTAIPQITSEFKSTSDIGWFGIGTTVGPLLGGVFTELVPPRVRPRFFDRILELDLLGNIFLLGACVMLFMALELTNRGQAWSSVRIIGLLSGSGATAIVFAAWQWWRQDGALIPPAIITHRTVAASCVAAFSTYGALMIHTYFLPLWFQAIRGEDAIMSGVDMIPYVATIGIFSLLSAVFVSVVGYPVPPAVVGGMIGTAGCGVLRLLSPSTPIAYWIGFEILVAAGFGMSIQQGLTAVQAVLPPDDISVGTAAVVASQSLGGAIFVSVGNTLFQNYLLRAAARNLVPGVNIRAVLRAGATAFRTAVPASALPRMMTVYNDALRVTFTAAIPLAGVAAIAACFMEWKSVKVKKAA
ncbi:Efflux pump roqT [Colletotrichum sp. SAR 10_70]|nr:Efflux pump roqT [Colletotrichum sp. SAR 10_71]KAI8184179.1 Efflux pump roqT [Colletotrichum sp. SAR 10_75]KAI8197592.1 Efflux pump roqT [Colletotrichum sp. SAR 10_70]KAI8207638.1 Efflux pump roqT [Colletotrichum sp. SAR 10_65]KAI8208925.1 Efflux pump roqT [Colletotrichum sp. SAR 10_76]